jgi:hypothetical protein
MLELIINRGIPNTTADAQQFWFCGKIQPNLGGQGVVA